MAFQPFDELFPELAKDETRFASVGKEGDRIGLPEGEYMFAELYCNEVGCDCRRVYFQVLSTISRTPLANITWGWEPAEFYQKWVRGFPRDEALEMAIEMKGPSLAPGSPQSDLAPALLNFAETILLDDEAYIERIKRHYNLVRQRIDSKSLGIDFRSARIIEIQKARKKERSERRKKGKRR